MAVEQDEVSEKWLRPLKNRPIYPKRICAVDSEDDGEGNLKNICFYDGDNNKFYDFYNRYDFITFLYNFQFKQKKLYIGACNLEYDIVNCFRDYWSDIEMYYGNRIVFAQLANREIYFFDTINLYGMSVKEQGEYVGKPKLEFNPDDINYRHRDAEIVYDFAVQFQRRLNDLGCEMKYTTPSSALNLFRRQFLKKGIKKIPDEILKQIKHAYHGGRTEIFTMEAKATPDAEIYYYDINSLYPYVMANNLFPVPDTYYESDGLVPYGVTHCDIEYIDDVYLPYLPLKWNGKLVFPTGKLTGWWTAYELKNAVDWGLIRIEKIYKSIGFEEKVDYFSSYIKYLYDLRKEAKVKGDKFLDLTLKLLMNSLYGKFGERVDSLKSMTENGELRIEQLEKPHYPPHCNMIMSAYVTAYARTVEYKYLKKVLDKTCKNMYSYNRLLYGDTDSILYQGEAGILDEGTELGQVKLEGAGRYKEAKFLLPKAYKLIDFTGKEWYKVKGVPKKLAPDFFETGKATWKKPIRLRESLKRVDKKKYLANRWVFHTKYAQSEYDKRLVIDEAGNTVPLNLTMW
jgi:hypothetical protein